MTFSNCIVAIWLFLMLANAACSAWRGTSKGHDLVALWLLVYLFVVVLGSAIKEAMT